MTAPPLSAAEREQLQAIGQLADLDQQAAELAHRLGAVLQRADQDEQFNAALVTYVYALEHAGQPVLADLVAALCAGRPFSPAFVERMASADQDLTLSAAERAHIYARQRRWDIAHGQRPQRVWLKKASATWRARLQRLADWLHQR